MEKFALVFYKTSYFTKEVNRADPFVRIPCLSYHTYGSFTCLISKADHTLRQCVWKTQIFLKHTSLIQNWTSANKATCLFGLFIRVRLGQVRLGQVRLGQVRLGQVRIGQVRLGQVRLGQVCSVFITLHFLHNLLIGPISQTVL